MVLTFNSIFIVNDDVYMYWFCFPVISIKFIKVKYLAQLKQTNVYLNPDAGDRLSISKHLMLTTIITPHILSGTGEVTSKESLLENREVWKGLFRRANFLHRTFQDTFRLLQDRRGKVYEIGLPQTFPPPSPAPS